MTELQIIARAQMYLEKLANGVNPLNDTEVDSDDIVNDVRISRCLFYSSGILKQIVDNNGRYKIEKPDKKDFSITYEQLSNFEFAEYGLSITEIAKRFNALIDIAYTKELKTKDITGWLVETGLLTNVVVNNKTRRRPTPRGESMGIYTEEGAGQYGMYEGMFYNTNMQHFIVNNINAIVEFSNKEKNQA